MTPPKTATPYWKALEIDGREPSPRETRSASKAKKSQCLVMCFSPPDQKANAEREQRILNEKEKQRAIKIVKARESGQLLVFSPNYSKKQKIRHSNMSDQNLAFTMDLSPDPTSSELTLLKKKLQEAEEGLLKAQVRCDDLESQLQNNQRQHEQEHKQLFEQLLLKENETATLHGDLDNLDLECEKLRKHLKESREEHEQNKHEISMVSVY